MMSASSGAQLGTRSSVPFTPLTRQSSIFSLTLDELQNAMDPNKHFGSMNMDEFLKNVWTAEESQAMAAALASTTEANAPQQAPAAPPPTGLVRQSSLSHPGSLSLSRTLSRKTVDEVWRDIHRGPEPTKEQQGNSNYGEMTLEDFLVKAGVVREEADGAIPASNITNNFVGSFPTALASQSPLAHGTALAQATHQATMEALAQNRFQQELEWHNYQLKNNAMQQQQAVLQHAAHEAAAAVAYAAPKRANVSLTIPGTPSGSGMEGSSDGGLGQVNGRSPAITTPDTPNTRGRKRGPEGVQEKTVERRQRRMIKNRESAARSRARKQAYTVELEAEVTQLKDDNERLKKETAEIIRRTELEARIQAAAAAAAAPKNEKCLRRTKTSSW